MYHFIFILSLVMSGVFCDTTIVSTKADLLAVIRQDLRRNNDDYIESTIFQPTFASPTPSIPPTSSQEPPVGTKALKTTNKLTTINITTKDLETIIEPLPFRRVFQSSEIQPIDDKPKKMRHRPIKMEPSQFLMTNIKIPGSESKRQTRFTRTYKREMARKNDLDQPGRKPKGSESGVELKKIHAFIKDLEKKEEMTKETSTLQAITLTKIQGITKATPQRIGLVMSRNEPPMVVPLRDKPPVDVPSLEDPSAPWMRPRPKTTRGEIRGMGLKMDLEDTPQWRAIASKEDSKLGKIQNKRAQNETTIKADVPENLYVKRVEKTEKVKLRKKKPADANKIINDLRMKLREGIKLSSLPPGELLDMWPARGPRVHALRLRNRLCQRSVLLNEGPKYDSKGGTYLPRFKPRLLGTKKVIDFHQTKIPKFLLPRCCNCCRKSVLGCE